MLPRWMHNLYAHFNGYFWLPCPLCGRMFGGHERHGRGIYPRTGGNGTLTCGRHQLLPNEAQVFSPTLHPTPSAPPHDGSLVAIESCMVKRRLWRHIYIFDEPAGTERFVFTAPASDDARRS